MVDDYGAYFQFGHGTHGNALAQVTGPYRIGSVDYTVQCVLTNKCQQGVFRGAGSDAGNFCLERLVDAAAQELGVDRVELRRRNFIGADRVPLQDAGRQHLRQRRLSGRAGPARSRWPALPELRDMQAEARAQGR